MEPTQLWLFFLMVLGIVILPGMDMAFVAANAVVISNAAVATNVVVAAEAVFVVGVFTII